MLGAIRRLRALGMELAEALVDQVKSPDGDEPPLAPAEAAIAFQRIAKAVRMTAALELRVLEEADGARWGESRASAEAEQRAAEQRRWQGRSNKGVVADTVYEILAETIGDTDAERHRELDQDLQEWVVEERDDEDFAGMDERQMLESVCEALGLVPDPALWDKGEYIEALAAAIIGPVIRPERAAAMAVASARANLAHVPEPAAAAARLRKDAVERLLKRHRIRRIDAQGLISLLRERPVQVAPGTAEAATAHIGLLAKRLTLVGQQIRQTTSRLDQLTQAFAQEDTAPGQGQAQRDATILRSLPGIGRLVHATLLAEAFDPLQRRDYHALRCLCGAAPVTKRSGKTVIVVRRRATNQRLANALYHWARVAVQRDPLSRAKYAALRARGRTHARALRTIGDRLLAVACAMLQSQTQFDPARARDTLRAA